MKTLIKNYIHWLACIGSIGSISIFYLFFTFLYLIHMFNNFKNIIVEMSAEFLTVLPISITIIIINRNS